MADDNLPALPDPSVRQYYWRGDNDSCSCSQWYEAGDPDADPRVDPPDEITPHYDADKMRAYARAAIAAQPVEPVARVEYTAAGPKLFVNGVLVRQELGCVHDAEFDAIALQINAAHSAAPISEQTAEPAPIDMILYCPNCGRQHVDAPEPSMQAGDAALYGGDWPERWTNPPHRSHQCHHCEVDGKPFVWRPADVPTNGVAEIKTRGKADTRPVNAGEISAQPAQQTADARDAARYRHLREHCLHELHFDHTGSEKHGGSCFELRVPFTGRVAATAEGLDAAIDAAAGKEKS